MLRIMLKVRRIWNIDGLLLTGEDGSTRRKPCPDVTFSTSFPWTVVGSNPGFRNMKPATDCLSHFNSACHLNSTCSFISYLTVNWGTLLVAKLVEALHYKPEGRGFDFRWGHRDVTEMSTRNIFWEVMAAGAYGWQLCHLHLPVVKKFWELQISWNPEGLSRPVE